MAGRPVGWGPGAVGLGSRAALDHGDGPDMEARLRELRDVADEFPERVLVGEVYMEPGGSSATTGRRAVARTCRSTSRS